MTTATLAPSPMHYVYDGRECVGFVLARGRKGHEALDRPPPPTSPSTHAQAGGCFQQHAGGKICDVSETIESDRACNSDDFHPLADSGSSLILGVDPGITGGLAFLFPTGEVEVGDIPVVAGEVDVDTLVRQVRAFSPALAVIERANAMPKQGVSSTFKYGVAYGALRTVVALCNIPYRLVTPGKWKNHFGLDSDKEKSRALAIQFWPGCGFFSRKKDHGRAEAALIARYGAETWSSLS